MANYTRVNLKEVEDQAPKFGMSPNVEARFAREPLQLQKSGMSYMKYAPGFRVPFGHKHKVQEEIYVLVGGSARIKIEDEILDLKPWDAVRVPPDKTRAIQAGPNGAEVIAFGAPGTGPGDGELIPGWWKN
jgi:mannose-6-phosphate isomerase-like protein (cupin superfamily)